MGAQQGGQEAPEGLPREIPVQLCCLHVMPPAVAYGMLQLASQRLAWLCSPLQDEARLLTCSIPSDTWQVCFALSNAAVCTL